MCERCAKTAKDTPAGKALVARRDRLPLWLIPHCFHCTIVGTCFTGDDMAKLSRKLDLRVAADARAYDIHHHFVQAAAEPGPAGKLMQKMLDEKFGGTVRRFAGETDPAGWTARWDEAVASGNVAGALWAVMTLTAAPEAVRQRAYGDVHMMSHLMGGETRQRLRSVQEAERRCAELEARLVRSERAATERLAAALAEKDERIRRLEAALADHRPAPDRRPASPAPRRAARAEREAVALRRRVAAERARARQAEAEVERLRRLLDAPAPVATASRADDGPADLDGRSILYVGGRPALMPHLRAAVEARNGSLLHHDGGMEQATRCLEGLVERADVVVCPIDCISHDACLRVKGMCRRLQKPFLPLRSAGASTFTRALGALGLPGAPSAHALSRPQP
ncbi:DUF2325 domain-containing protein [Azospirillum halopraeferens]|uniref:DUF2325 domain-containing protein n=1 Tax=Azospirillum halopraeferens TaxID=34010 RepID=UPI000425B3D9|nr:DUF2325 domain-containing protein [Azospirillum halopraeferens]